MSTPEATPATIVLGTRNRKKAEELIDQLAGLPIEVRALDHYPNAPEVDEDGQTFLENARKKTVETSRAIGEWVLGEDSGLVVDALGGRPGVLSARYSGAHGTDELNNQKLLAELTGVPDERRTAHYVCTAALADPQGSIRIEVEGRCHGRIGHVPRGTEGFGYDPLFIIPEYHKTFGELGSLVKRYLSHRARALAQLRARLRSLFGQAIVKAP